MVLRTMGRFKVCVYAFVVCVFCGVCVWLCDCVCMGVVQGDWFYF